jgi:hypothetical protein
VMQVLNLLNRNLSNFVQARELQSLLLPQSIRRGTIFAERTWQSLRKLAQCILVHAWLDDRYIYHALLQACSVFNILPLKDLVTAAGTVTTPFWNSHYTIWIV